MSEKHTTEVIDQLKMAALSEVDRGMGKVGKSIDKLTSASLKRVLKTITHVHLAEAILQNKQMKLSENEQQLVDNCFDLIQSVMGYTQLMNELKGASNGQQSEVAEQKQE